MEWNRRNIIGAIVILVLGFGAGGVIYVHQEGGLGFVMFRLEKWADGLYGGVSEMTAEQEIVAKREAKRIRKVIFEKYPSLQMEGREVASELNGYLAFFELAKHPDLQLLMSSEILFQVNEEKIDPALIRKELAAYDAIGKEIERIAALPEQSNVIDGKLIDELLPAVEVNTMGEYLMLQARLAAMDGDESKSIKFLSLAVNLTEHIGDIESPCALTEIVRTGLRSKIRTVFFQQILPVFGKSAHLEKWASMLQPQTDFPKLYSRMLKGSFNLLSDSTLYFIWGDVPDPAQTILAYAKWVEANALQFDNVTIDKLQSAKYISHNTFTKRISREGIEFIEDMLRFEINILDGFLYAVFNEHHQAAALDLLIREQKGEDLSTLTETFLLNPYTAKPFAYDATTRTLSGGFGTKYTVLSELKLPW